MASCLIHTNLEEQKFTGNQTARREMERENGDISLQQNDTVTQPVILSVSVEERKTTRFSLSGVKTQISAHPHTYSEEEHPHHKVMFIKARLSHCGTVTVHTRPSACMSDQHSSQRFLWFI